MCGTQMQCRRRGTFPRVLVTFAIGAICISLGPKSVWGRERTESSPSKLRAKAENAIVSNNLKDAASFLTQAIRLEPDNADNYFKRHRVYQRQKRYSRAIGDLRTATGLPPTRSHLSIHKALVRLLYKSGECEEAKLVGGRAMSLAETIEKPEKRQKEKGKVESDLRRVTQCATMMTNVERLVGMSIDAICAIDHFSFITAAKPLFANRDGAQIRGSEKQLREAIGMLNELIQQTPYTPKFLLARAHIHLKLSEYYETLADTGKALKIDRANLAALGLRAYGYYKLRDHEMAKRHVRECLKFDPEHKGCKRTHNIVKRVERFHSKAEVAFESGNFDEAVKLFQQSIDADRMHKEHVRVCAARQSDAHMKLKQYEAAKMKAEEVLRMHPDDASAHVRLGDVLLALEEFEEAVRAMERAHKINPNDQSIRNHVQRAKVALKQSKEVNYYKVLGVGRDATQREIKKAYRKLALELHPDRHEGEDAKAKAETEFQKVAMAHEILSDEEMRAKYDRGEDVTGNPQRGPSNAGFGFPFHMFNRGGGGGGQRFHFKFG